MLTISKDILIDIFSRLNTHDLKNIALTNKYFKQISSPILFNELPLHKHYDYLVHICLDINRISLEPNADSQSEKILNRLTQIEQVCLRSSKYQIEFELKALFYAAKTILYINIKDDTQKADAYQKLYDTLTTIHLYDPAFVYMIKAWFAKITCNYSEFLIYRANFKQTVDEKNIEKVDHIVDHIFEKCLANQPAVLHLCTHIMAIEYSNSTLNRLEDEKSNYLYNLRLFNDEDILKLFISNTSKGASLWNAILFYRTAHYDIVRTLKQIAQKKPKEAITYVQNYFQYVFLYLNASRFKPILSSYYLLAQDLINISLTENQQQTLLTKLFEKTYTYKITKNISEKILRNLDREKVKFIIFNLGLFAIRYGAQVWRDFKDLLLNQLTQPFDSVFSLAVILKHIYPTLSSEEQNTIFKKLLLLDEKSPLSSMTGYKWHQSQGKSRFTVLKAIQPYLSSEQIDFLYRAASKNLEDINQTIEPADLFTNDYIYNKLKNTHKILSIIKDHLNNQKKKQLFKSLSQLNCITDLKNSAKNNISFLSQIRISPHYLLKKVLVLDLYYYLTLFNPGPSTEEDKQTANAINIKKYPKTLKRMNKHTQIYFIQQFLITGELQDKTTSIVKIFENSRECFFQAISGLPQRENIISTLTTEGNKCPFNSDVTKESSITAQQEPSEEDILNNLKFMGRNNKSLAQNRMRAFQYIQTLLYTITDTKKLKTIVQTLEKNRHELGYLSQRQGLITLSLRRHQWIETTNASKDASKKLKLNRICSPFFSPKTSDHFFKTYDCSRTWTQLMAEFQTRLRQLNTQEQQVTNNPNENPKPEFNDTIFLEQTGSGWTNTKLRF